MQNKVLRSLLVVALLIGASSTVAARDRWHGGHGWHRGHSGSHFGFYFGVPLFWDPYPAYYGYRYYDRYPPTVIVQPPPVYVQQPRAYWYYCPDPAGYYPTVRSCPSGWMPVLPNP